MNELAGAIKINLGFRSGFIVKTVIATSVMAIACVISIAPITQSQTEEDLVVTPSKATSVPIPSDGLYFADVVVRNRPIFQIGSLPQIDASARAEIINRRIASLLAQNETVDAVNIAPDNPRKNSYLKG